MRRIIILLLYFPLIAFSQKGELLNKEELTKIYSQAIADFITASNKKNGTSFDTLFIGKRSNGQADDFPDIRLPGTIANTNIRLITPEEGAISQKEVRTRIYINLIGWVNKEKADFMFYVFSNGFDHQYNHSINYNYNFSHTAFEFEKEKFKDPGE